VEGAVVQVAASTDASTRRSLASGRGPAGEGLRDGGRSEAALLVVPK